MKNNGRTFLCARAGYSICKVELAGEVFIGNLVFFK